MDKTSTFPFPLGNFHCIAINDGIEATPFEKVVKDVPAEQIGQALTERGNAPSDGTTYFNCLYVDTGAQRILVDAGWGQGVQRRDGALLERLNEAGLSPADIDLLVITHGDVDHIGGILTADGQLTFPNAEYVLLKDAWDFWNNALLVARWPEPLTVFGRKTLPSICDRVRVVEAGQECLPGLRLFHAPGHRPGHATLEIESQGKRLYHLADVVGHAILMEHPTWTWAFDARPDLAIQDKQALLPRIVDQDALVFGSHLPFPGVGHVVPGQEGWRFQPLERREGVHE